MARFLNLVQGAIEYMEDRLTEKISVSTVCRSSYLSPWYFQRVFRAYTGESVGRYLRRRRLSSAIEDLHLTGGTVLDVALKYQFGSSEAFSRACKQVFGLSPNRLRAQGTVKLSPKKTRLTAAALKSIRPSLDSPPPIRRLRSFSVLGMETEFESPLSRSHRYLPMVRDVWLDFYGTLPSLRGIRSEVMIGVSYGLYRSYTEGTQKMSYVASCRLERKPSRVASPYVVRRIPANRYAIFQYLGFHRQTQYMVDYIYSTWLPSSAFLRGEGPEFTTLDCSSGPPDPENSLIRYHLPVVPRSRR
jgi:AraC family transcriptional regulator